MSDDKQVLIRDLRAEERAEMDCWAKAFNERKKADKKRTWEQIVEDGNWLVEKAARLKKKGEWKDWCEKSLDCAYSTVCNMIVAHKVAGKCPTIGLVLKPGTIYRLGAKGVSKEYQDTTYARINAGECPTDEEVNAGIKDDKTKDPKATARKAAKAAGISSAIVTVVEINTAVASDEQIRNCASALDVAGVNPHEVANALMEHVATARHSRRAIEGESVGRIRH
jgi:hypothetical protein